MDALTKQVRTFEQAIVQVVNSCGLPPVVCRLVLSNVLNEVKNIEEKTTDPVQKGGEDNGTALYEDAVGE